LFIGALGLLTFISIFYNFTIASGKKLVQDVKTILKDKGDKEINKLLLKIIKEKDNIKKLDKLNEVRTKAYKIEEFIDYLNFNKWLFISVSSYLTSIVFYLLPRFNWTVFIQVISFWIGLSASSLIVTSWFAVNELHIKK